jgi:hypothetical protein
MVLEKGHVEAQGELWGKKQFGFKPPLDMPTIAWLHNSITQGHIKEGAYQKRI